MRPGTWSALHTFVELDSLLRQGDLENPCLSSDDNPRMAQGKRISADIPAAVLASIQDMGVAARLARTSAGEGQAAAAARLGVHVQTVGRIEAGEPGVAIGHVLGLLALYGVKVEMQQPDAAAP
jgi:DNA-binding XRE family transcriptional regulator